MNLIFLTFIEIWTQWVLCKLCKRLIAFILRWASKNEIYFLNESAKRCFITISDFLSPVSPHWRLDTKQGWTEWYEKKNRLVKQGAPIPTCHRKSHQSTSRGYTYLWRAQSGLCEQSKVSNYSLMVRIIIIPQPPPILSSLSVYSTI